MNELSKFDNQELNLEILAEECAEVSQIKSKIIRFGLDDQHPVHAPNRVRLEEEIGHLMAMVKILVANGTITQEGIDRGEREKLAKLPKWYGAGWVPGTL